MVPHYHLAGCPGPGRTRWLALLLRRAHARTLEPPVRLGEQDLRDWRRLLELRRDWLRERGIKYLFIVPPDKHTIYPEYLPTWMEPSSKPSKLQQLAEYMKTHSDVEFIDLSQTLIDAKKIRVNYLQTDTHWNAFGGFVAYRTLVQGLSRQLPELEPLPLDAYEWKPVAASPWRPHQIGQN